jgi:ribulose-bisphosphate carboxylase large chain
VSKPLGLSSRQLADLVGLLARAGIDIIKDDHSLADQPTAPFRDRVDLCQQAVEEANRSTGRSAVYFPSLGGCGRELSDNVRFLQETGCRGAVVIPFYLGLDTVAGLASDSDLALLAHPSGSGVFFDLEHGVAPEVYLGQVLRIAGCDAVIYPHAGGRFRMDESTASAISSNLLGELGTLRRSAPAPGGSIESAALVEWLDLYGPDSVFVVGSSVTRAEDPTAAAEELVSTVLDAFA